jgi:hypothetical protein
MLIYIMWVQACTPEQISSGVHIVVFSGFIDDKLVINYFFFFVGEG